MKKNSSAERPARLRDRLREETAAAILSAAEESFASDGLQARMESIAGRAGVAVGTVYNHFQDREALLAELVRSRRAVLLRRLDAAVAEEGPFAELLRRFLQALFGHWTEHWRFMGILVQAQLLGKPPRPGGAPPSILQEVNARAGRVVARGLAEGALRPGERDLYAAVLVGMARGALLHDLEASRPAPLAERLEQVVELFLRGSGSAP